MPHALTPEQLAHVDRLYQHLREQNVAPEYVLEWFRRVPRHCFIDELHVHEPAAGFSGEAVRITPQLDDPAILARIYTDSALSIQVQGGRCTSSTSQPSLMAQMIVDVDLRPGSQVLEIGTATGWNAAIMSGVVGPDGWVVSVECDPELADRAREHLAREGYHRRVTVVAADGVLGYPTRAPFDAIVVTVACPDVPQTWLRQLAPGGRLIMPYGLPDASAPMLVLQRREDRYVGGFLRWSWFVHLRGEGLQSWPAPLDPEADDRLAALLRRQPKVAPLAAIPEQHVGLEEATLGLYLLAVERDYLVTIDAGPTASRQAARYALYDPAGKSLCILGSGEYRTYGDRTMGEWMARHVRRWADLGHPRITRYRVEAVPAAAAPEPISLVRPETILQLGIPAGGQDSS